MNFYTARINYDGPDRIDISRKGCDQLARAKYANPGIILAPSAGPVYPTLRAMKAATTDAEREQVWTGYVAAYHLEMLDSYKACRAEWEALLARDRAVLCCFCVDSTHCHRTLAAGYLARLGATYLGEIGALNP